jgi:hypothetical protein
MNEAILAQLRSILIQAAAWHDQGLPFLIDVGQMGEAIVAAMHPDWKRAPRGTTGYDFIDTEGRRVQVKTWGSKARRTFDDIRQSADRVVVIKLHDAGWDVLCDRLTAGLFPIWPEGKAKMPVYRKMHLVERLAA